MTVLSTGLLRPCSWRKTMVQLAKGYTALLHISRIVLVHFFSPLTTVINLADPSQHHSSYFHPCRSYKKPFEWSLGLVSSPCAAGEGGSHHLQVCDPPRTYAVTHTKATARCIGHRNQRERRDRAFVVAA